MVAAGAKRLFRFATDLVYPLRCAGCARFDRPLCAACTERLVPATGPGRCGHCSAAWDGTDFCPRCFHLQDIAGVRAAFEMNGPARQLIHNLKYRRYRTLVRLMAGHVADAAKPLPVDHWYAVPLHSSRFRERGFNQSEELLRVTSLPTGEGTLLRLRKTATQVGQHLAERRQNVAGAFAYRGPRLDGRRVGLIDDVVTTGATINECARVLLDAGAAEVWAVGFARASYNPASTAEISE